MRTIHKHLIGSGPSISRILVHEGFKILSFQMQDRAVTGWFEVDTEAFLTVVWFENVATGGVVPSDGTYVATVQDGMYVWHIYRLSK